MTEPYEELEAMNQALTAAYGPLLRHRDVAKAMGTSPESLGNTLRRGKEINVLYLRSNKLRFGRRVFYPAKNVAESLILDDEELARRMLETEASSIVDRDSKGDCHEHRTLN